MNQYKTNQILHGDALTKLKELESESVDCICTSPPYWALRSYETEGQIWDGKEDCEHDFQKIETYRPNSQGGSNPKLLSRKGKDNFQAFTDYNNRKTYSNQCSKCNAWKGELGQEPTIELYINHLIQIFSEAKRVLKKEGTCWVVLGDTYSSSTSGNNNGSGKSGLTSAGKGKDILICDMERIKKKTGLQDKTLCMIPERFAIKMIDNNWVLRNKIIWWKPNRMPSSAKDRFTVDYEYVYFFSKSQKYYFKTQYDKYDKPLNRWGGDVVKTPSPENTKGRECALPFREKGIPERPNPEGRIKRCVWTINTKPFSEAHFAVFPEELVKQCLDAGCPENGTILDMFMGSGTVALVALKNNRRFMGIELNEDYVNIANKRIDPYLKQSKLLI